MGGLSPEHAVQKRQRAETSDKRILFCGIGTSLFGFSPVGGVAGQKFRTKVPGVGLKRMNGDVSKHITKETLL